MYEYLRSSSLSKIDVSDIVGSIFSCLESMHGEVSALASTPRYFSTLSLSPSSPRSPHWETPLPHLPRRPLGLSEQSLQHVRRTYPSLIETSDNAEVG